MSKNKNAEIVFQPKSALAISPNSPKIAPRTIKYPPPNSIIHIELRTASTSGGWSLTKIEPIANSNAEISKREVPRVPPEFTAPESLGSTSITTPAAPTSNPTSTIPPGFSPFGRRNSRKTTHSGTEALMIAATPEGTPSFSPCVTNPTPPTNRNNAANAARPVFALGIKIRPPRHAVQAIRITPAPRMWDAAKRNAGIDSTPALIAKKFSP